MKRIFSRPGFFVVPENEKPEDMWPPVDPSGVPVDEVAVLLLPGDPSSVLREIRESMKCPVPTAVNAATSLRQSGKNSPFHITSSMPVSACDILPCGGAQLPTVIVPPTPQ